MSGGRSLDLRGHKGRRLANAFFPARTGAGALAILFGGWNYSTDMPLHFYARELLVSLGSSVLTVDFRYASDPRYARLSEQKRREWFLGEVEGVLEASRRLPHRGMILVAKSLATMAIAHLVLGGRLEAESRLVWLSPLLDIESMRTTLAGCRYESLVVVGNRDPRYDSQTVRRLRRNPRLEVMVLQRANEDLEAAGDITRSIGLLPRYLERLKNFVEPASGDTRTSRPRKRGQAR